MRTIVDIPSEDITALETIAKRERVSRAEIVRRAVKIYADEHGPDPIEAVFGLWKGRGIDALAYEDEIRGPREG